MARARKFLLVAPSEMSTGEAVTLVGVAEDLESAGSSCTFLASHGIQRYIEPGFPGQVQTFGESLQDNQRLWADVMARTRPDAIVFADYPLLFFVSGSVPLVSDQWVDSLERAGPALFTLDHLGYAQKSRVVAFGPPHMTFGMEVTAALPQSMKVLLPCPINDPAPGSDRCGLPFRSGPAHEISEVRRRTVRARYVEDARTILVLHAAPGWAVHLARQLRLPHYQFLHQILAELFRGLDRPVVVVSVGSDPLPTPSRPDDFRVFNVPSMPPSDFEGLIAASDLMLTDNAISASLGKAVCLGRACAVLVNSSSVTELYDRRDEPGARWAAAIEAERPGAIFPWDVFPIWNRDDLDRLGFGEGHAFRRCIPRIETFGGDATRATLSELLGDSALRDQLADARRDYMRQVAALPAPAQALAAALA